MAETLANQTLVVPRRLVPPLGGWGTVGGGVGVWWWTPCWVLKEQALCLGLLGWLRLVIKLLSPVVGWCVVAVGGLVSLFENCTVDASILAPPVGVVSL